LKLLVQQQAPCSRRRETLVQILKITRPRCHHSSRATAARHVEAGDVEGQGADGAGRPAVGVLLFISKKHERAKSLSRTRKRHEAQLTETIASNACSVHQPRPYAAYSWMNVESVIRGSSSMKRRDSRGINSNVASSAPASTCASNSKLVMEGEIVCHAADICADLQRGAA